VRKQLSHENHLDKAQAEEGGVVLDDGPDAKAGNRRCHYHRQWDDPFWIGI